MLKPHGYTFVTDLDGKVHEGETFKCVHCGAHTEVKPFQRPEDLGGYCHMCNGATCAKCASTGLCDPLERKMARWEKSR